MSPQQTFLPDETDAELILKLEQNYADPNLKKGKVKKTKHTIFDTNLELTSWKFNEWDYGKPDKVKLPSEARGLFTLDDRIVVRGYDKFFNVNEVPTTHWKYILDHTTGPYELTLKENGCIIFISGLENGKLVVCSKHSTGYRDDVQRNHAEYGYVKLKEQLDSLGIDHTRLGEELFNMNLTAVLELCDDEFEEHVLRYSKEESGLYLHGLNYNSATFKTYPMSLVHEFADKFGFKKISYLQQDNSKNLKSFLEDCAKTGTYEGKEVEGFVIRAKLVDSQRDFFFKYKFEEPYLMYRQWREVTKELIAGKSVSELTITKHKYQTLKYIEYILPLLREDEQLQKNYQISHGVIELREKYLQHSGKKGFEIAADDINPSLTDFEFQSLSLKNLSLYEKKVKYVIVPVATIGCGKTTIALALKYLFPTWSHIQNDDIPNPVKEKLVKGALSLLQDSPCCFIDRNNHMKRERKQIFDDFEKFTNQYEFSSEYRLKFICLDFVQDKKKIQDDLWKITQSRVLERGNNHQSIKLESSGKSEVENIMRGFIGRFQKVDENNPPDNSFNMICRLQMNNPDSTLQNLRAIITQIHNEYPDLIPEIPSEEQILESFKYALSYKPTIDKIVKSHSSQTKLKKQPKPAYFALGVKDPSVLISKVEDLLLVSDNDKMKVLYQSFKQLNRLQDEFHVTLTHISSLKTNRTVYNNYTKKYFPHELQKFTADKASISMQLPLSKASIKLEKICCTGELFCLQVSISLEVQNQEPNDVICSNNFPHITLGTLDDSIPAFKSNQVLEDINDFLYGTERGYYELAWTDEVILTTDELQLFVHN